MHDLTNPLTCSTTNRGEGHDRDNSNQCDSSSADAFAPKPPPADFAAAAPRATPATATSSSNSNANPQSLPLHRRNNAPSHSCVTVAVAELLLLPLEAAISELFRQNAEIREEIRLIWEDINELRRAQLNEQLMQQMVDAEFSSYVGGQHGHGHSHEQGAGAAGAGAGGLGGIDIKPGEAGDQQEQQER